MKKEDFKYGIIIKLLGEEVHFCGFMGPPTKEVFDELKKEMSQDQEFGFCEEAQNGLLTFELASKECLDRWIGKIGKI